MRWSSVPRLSEKVDIEQAWLDEVIRRRQAANTVEQHNNMPGPNAPPVSIRIKMEPEEFADANIGLANMRNGEALTEEKPEPLAQRPLPTKSSKNFSTSHTRFLLASSASSNALGPLMSLTFLLPYIRVVKAHIL